MWRVFYEKAVVELHTKALCADLNAMEEAPWSTAKRGQPIDGNYLHRHLRDFIPGEAEAIAPRKFYVGGVEARGYNEKHFQGRLQPLFRQAAAVRRAQGRRAQESPGRPYAPAGGL